MALTFAALEKVLQDLSEQDTKKLKAAEEAFDELVDEYEPPQVFSVALAILRSKNPQIPEEQVIRRLACIAMVSCVQKSSERRRFEISEADFAQLLLKTEQENDEYIRGELARSLGLIASLSHLPRVRKVVFNWLDSSSERTIECGFLVLYHIGPTFTALKGKVAERLAKTFDTGLSHASAKVRIAAMRAFGSIVFISDEPKHFRHLVPKALECLDLCLKNKHEKIVVDVLEVFIDVCSKQPSFLKANCEKVVNAMASIVERGAEQKVMQYAMNMVVTCFEQFPAILDKSEILEKIFGICLHMTMSELNEDQWEDSLQEDVDDSADGDNLGALSNYDIGIECLDALAIAIGGKKLLPLILKRVPAMIKDMQDWRKRFTAIMILSQTFEGCAEQYEKFLPNIVEEVVKALSDPVLRIRYAACYSSGLLFKDFGGKVQQTYAHVFLQAFIKLLNDPGKRVQMNTNKAIVSFFEAYKKSPLPEDLYKYLEEIAPILLSKLQSNEVDDILKAQVLLTTAAVSKVFHKTFHKHFDAMSSHVKMMLTSEACENLTNQSCYALTQMYCAVGHEYIKDIALVLVKQIAKMYPSDISADIALTCCKKLLRAHAITSTSVNEKGAKVTTIHSVVPGFLKLVPFLMPIIFEEASCTPSISSEAATGEDDERNEEGLEAHLTFIPGIGYRRILVDEGAVNDKTKAQMILLQFASALKEHFWVYVEKTALIIKDNIRCSYSDSIQKNAAATAGVIMQCIIDVTDKGWISYESKYLSGLSEFLVTALIGKSDHKPKTQAIMASSMLVVLQAMFKFQAFNKQEDKPLSFYFFRQFARFIAEFLQQLTHAQKQLAAEAEEAEEMGETKQKEIQKTRSAWDTAFDKMVLICTTLLKSPDKDCLFTNLLKENISCSAEIAVRFMDAIQSAKPEVFTEQFRKDFQEKATNAFARENPTQNEAMEEDDIISDSES